MLLWRDLFLNQLVQMDHPLRGCEPLQTECPEPEPAAGPHHSEPAAVVRPRGEELCWAPCWRFFTQEIFSHVSSWCRGLVSVWTPTDLSVCPLWRKLRLFSLSWRKLKEKDKRSWIRIIDPMCGFCRDLSVVCPSQKPAIFIFLFYKLFFSQSSDLFVFVWKSSSSSQYSAFWCSVDRIYCKSWIVLYLYLKKQLFTGSSHQWVNGGDFNCCFLFSTQVRSKTSAAGWLVMIGDDQWCSASFPQTDFFEHIEH